MHSKPFSYFFSLGAPEKYTFLNEIIVDETSGILLPVKVFNFSLTLFSSCFFYRFLAAHKL